MKPFRPDFKGALAHCEDSKCRGARDGKPYHEIILAHGYVGKLRTTCPYCAGPMARQGFNVPADAIEFDDDSAASEPIPDAAVVAGRSPEDVIVPATNKPED